MGLLIIAFIACGWYFSGSLNQDLKSQVDSRKQLFQKLDRASKSSVSLPLTEGSFSANGTLNKSLLESLEVLSEKMSTDVVEARKTALAHNGDPYPDQFPHPNFNERSQGTATSGKRLLVSESLFPSPPSNEREDLQNKVHRALMQAYATMLAGAGAGQPPAVADVEKQLIGARSNFIQADKRKGTEADLTSAEKDELTNKLSATRLQFYNEAASKIRFYGSTNAFQLPDNPFQTKIQHSLGELYGWHWDWWIAEDIISAIVAANTGDNPDEFIPVQHAPVKRLVSLRSLSGTPGAGKGNGKGGGGSTFGNSSGRNRTRGNSGGNSKPASNQNAGGPLGEPQISMDVASSNDFSVSFTGRQSNELYDVRPVELVVVIETAELPSLVNALARQNFITITDLTLQPTSAFDAAEFGYMFGDQPISLVTMRLETIWFRKWTAAWMPQDVRDALGVKSKGT